MKLDVIADLKGWRLAEWMVQIKWLGIILMKAHYTAKNKKTFKQKKVKNFLINGKQNSLHGMLF